MNLSTPLEVNSTRNYHNFHDQCTSLQLNNGDKTQQTNENAQKIMLIIFGDPESAEVIYF